MTAGAGAAFPVPRYRLLRAADLDRRLQQLGQGLGEAVGRDPGARQVHLDPQRLLEVLRPWVGLS